MRILLTNDDGINARGLDLLETSRGDFPTTSGSSPQPKSSPGQGIR